MSAGGSYTCPGCGLPFQSIPLLENHQSRFCLSSRVDREANAILQRVEFSGQQNAAVPMSGNNKFLGEYSPPPLQSSSGVAPVNDYGGKRQMSSIMQPNGMMVAQQQPYNYSAVPVYRSVGSNFGAPASPSSLPSVDFELFQLIRTQQQQLNLMQGIIGLQCAPQQNASNYPPRQSPRMPFDMSPQQVDLQHLEMLRQQQQPMAPLAALTGESSLTEGRYGLQVFAVDGLDAVLGGTSPSEVSVLVREYLGTVEQSSTSQGGKRNAKSAPPSMPLLMLDTRGEHSFQSGCIKSKKGHRQGLTLKKVEVAFSLLQHRELHVFVFEFYDNSGKLLCWSDVAIDSLGEKTRPLRLPPVETVQALRSAQLRAIPGALLGLETFRTSWKTQHGGKHHSASVDSSSESSSASSSSSDEERRRKKKKKKPHHQRRASPSPSPSNNSPPPPVGPSKPTAPPERKASETVPFPTQPSGGADPLSVNTTPKTSPLVDNSKKPATPQPPGQRVKCGRGPQKDACRLSIDGLVGIPFNVVSTRVLIYLAHHLDERNREIYPLDDDRFFLREPELTCYQTLDSNTMEPVFMSEMNCVIGSSTCAVAVIECVEPKKGKFTLGHAILQINQNVDAGNYQTRVMTLDPRPSHLRHSGPKDVEDEQKHQLQMERYDATQLNASLLAKELREVLATVSASQQKEEEDAINPSRFWPLAYIKWRADSNDRNKPYHEPRNQLPLTDPENILAKDRERITSKTTIAKGVTTLDAVVKQFAEKMNPVDDNLSYMAPYQPTRGIFVHVECLRGMTAEKALYKVTAEVFGADDSVVSQMTQHFDFASDIGAPGFADPPFLFQNIPYNPNACVLFRVYKMIDPSIDTPGGVMPFAWSCAKLFLEDEVARLGRFSTPLFAGTPPPKLVDDLKSDRIDAVIQKWTTNPPSGQKVSYATPKSLITFSQGEAIRAMELVMQEQPFRFEPRVLLVPQRLKKEFPLLEDDGFHEEELSSMIPPGKSADQMDDAMNKQIRKFFKRQ